MKIGGWSARVVIKYTLLQIPGLVALILILFFVKKWVELSSSLIIGIISVWIIKDAVLFPFVWKAYDRERPGDPLTMIGQRGKARERLDPKGYAFIRGELWEVEVAEGGSPIEEGTAVRVRDMQGLKLIVEKDRN